MPWTPSASIFDDPAWVGVIVGIAAMVVGAAVAIGVALWQRGPKPVMGLGYRVSFSKLLRSRAMGRLHIVFEDHELRDGGLVRFQLRNTGNQPIAKAAFDGPLSLVFDPSVKLLEASVVSVNPESLEPIASIAVADALGDDSNAPRPSAPRLEIQALSLNPGASFTVELLVDGAAAQTRLLGNVVGVMQPVELPDEGPVPSPVATAARRSWEVASVILSLAGALVAILSFFFGVGGSGKHSTRVVLSGSRSICASEYRLTDRGITAAAEGSGQVINIPGASVRAIRRDAC